MLKPVSPDSGRKDGDQAFFFMVDDEGHNEAGLTSAHVYVVQRPCSLLRTCLLVVLSVNSEYSR